MDAGLNITHICLPPDSSEAEIIDEILKINEDTRVHGLALQISENSFSNKVLNALKPEKDVDGVTDINLGRLVRGDAHECYISPVARAVIELLEKSASTPLANYLPADEPPCFCLTFDFSLLLYFISKTQATAGPCFKEFRLQTSADYSGNREGVHPIERVCGGTLVTCGGAQDGASTGVSLRPPPAPVTGGKETAPGLGAPRILCQANTKLLEADIVVLGSPKPEEIPLSWIQPGTTVLNCSNDFLSEHGQQWKEMATRTAACKVETSLLETPASLPRAKVSARIVCRDIRAPKGLRYPKLPIGDLEISKAQTPKAVDVLAKEIGLLADEIEIYGKSKAKVRLSLLERLKDQADGKYVLVAGITPTPLGEGKSTVTVGLVQAMTAHLNINSFACLRQPSQGPTFGVKGGAAGGGYAQVIPMEEFNLHLTGDIHAITAANNLLAAAALYNRLVPSVNGVREFSSIQLARLKKLGINKTDPNALTEEEMGKFARLNIDPSTITWQRVLDTNDRFLRKITIGQAPTEKGYSRQLGRWSWIRGGKHSPKHDGSVLGVSTFKGKRCPTSELEWARTSFSVSGWGQLPRGKQAPFRDPYAGLQHGNLSVVLRPVPQCTAQPGDPSRPSHRLACKLGSSEIRVTDR
ncbi:hypothetical protein GH733_000819 [Mirounga leonina]|nr:hypothetical protein GH733_000819 [Mirounga leonina]